MVTIVVSAFLLIADIVLTIVFSISAMNRTTKIIQSKVMEDAYTAAELLEGTDIGGMTLEDKTNQSETYVKCYTILDSFKTSSENTDAGLNKEIKSSSLLTHVMILRNS